MKISFLCYGCVNYDFHNCRFIQTEHKVVLAEKIMDQTATVES